MSTLIALPSVSEVIWIAPSSEMGSWSVSTWSCLQATGQASRKTAFPQVSGDAMEHSSFCLSQDHGQTLLSCSKDSQLPGEVKPGQRMLLSFMDSGITAPPRLTILTKFSTSAMVV